MSDIIRLIPETYLAVIRNSVGSKLFRSFYAKVNGKKTDVMRKGELSCAFFVSSILTLFKLAKEVHATVDSTIKDMRESGWKKCRKPKIGCILLWEEMDFDRGCRHKHIGFFVGRDKAVSNSTKLHVPAAHHWTFNGKRKIRMMLAHPKIQQP
jgi:hypothetical protein